MNKCLTEEQLLGYVRDKLGEDERIRIENHLLQCSLCFDAAEGIAELDSTENADYHIKDLNADLKLKLNTGFELGKFKFYISAAALFLIACSAVLFFWNRSNSEKLFEEYYKPYPNIIPMVRGSDEDFNLKAAMILYNSGSYEQAVTEFDKILSTDDKNESALFYKGISLLSLGKGEKANPEFQKVINIKDSRLKDQAEWYFALSFLQEDKPENAGKVLTKIIAENNYYSNQASELNARIDRENE